MILQKRLKIADTKRAVNLRKIADGLNAKIERKRNTFAGANLTRKRQRIIASANADADHMERQRVILRRLADLWESGDVPDYLQGIRNCKTVDTLIYDVQRMEKSFPYFYGYDAKYFYCKPDYEQAVFWASLVLNGVDTSDRDLERQIKRLTAEARLSKYPGYFPTPAETAVIMLAYIDREPRRVLEPSAGSGELADAILAQFPDSQVDCYEVVYALRDILKLKGHNLIGDDFMAAVPEPAYDVVLMNPPFEKGQDIEHVRHAARFLNQNGVLVSVVSASAEFRNDKKYRAFRVWLQEVGGYFVKLSGGSFKESGTAVNTRLVVIR